MVKSFPVSSWKNLFWSFSCEDKDHKREIPGTPERWKFSFNSIFFPLKIAEGEHL